MRLAALFALMDQRDEVCPDDLEAAVALVSYMADTITHLAPEITSSNDAPLPVRVEAFIRSHGDDGVKSTEVLRKFAKSKAEIEAIISGLSTIETFTGPSTGGRPPRIYRYLSPDSLKVTCEATVNGSTKFSIDLPEIEETSETASTGDMKEESPVAYTWNLDEIWETVNTHDTTPEEASDLPRGVNTLRARLDTHKVPTTVPMTLFRAPA